MWRLLLLRMLSELDVCVVLASVRALGLSEVAL